MVGTMLHDWIFYQCIGFPGDNERRLCSLFRISRTLVSSPIPRPHDRFFFATALDVVLSNQVRAMVDGLC